MASEPRTVLDPKRPETLPHGPTFASQPCVPCLVPAAGAGSFASLFCFRSCVRVRVTG